MQNCKLVKVPIPMGEKFTIEQCPKTHEEIEEMEHVSYESVVSSLMYTIFCIQQDISHVVEVLRRYMLTHGKEHWKVVKRVFKYLCGTKDYGICYEGKPEANNEVNAYGFVNIDSVGDMDQ
jgi:hypothetical protein